MVVKLCGNLILNDREEILAEIKINSKIDTSVKNKVIKRIQTIFEDSCSYIDKN